MKRLFAYLCILAIFTAVAFAGCSKASPYSESELSPYVKMTLTGVTESGASALLENSSGQEFDYGEYYAVEQKVNGEWCELEYSFKGDVGWNDIAYIIPSGGVSTQVIDWEWLYGKLGSGEYRLVIPLLSEKESIVTAIFVIG